MICLIFSYVFSSTKLKKQVEQVLPGSGNWRGWGLGGQVAQTMCINVSKCKNNKIKGGKKKKQRSGGSQFKARQIVCETVSQKKKNHKIGLVEQIKVHALS
jgi:hypothetical protein